MPTNAQRWFMRKEEYEPRKSCANSPFCCFDVKCLKCGCYKLAVTVHRDDESDEMFLVFQCSRCRLSERLKVHL